MWFVAPGLILDGQAPEDAVGATCCEQRGWLDHERLQALSMNAKAACVCGRPRLSVSASSPPLHGHGYEPPLTDRLRTRSG
jgi:hypothetical protein